MRAGQGQANHRSPTTAKNVLLVLGVVVALALASGALVARQMAKQKVPVPQPMMSGLAHAVASIDPLDRLLIGSGDRTIVTEFLTIERVWIDSCERTTKGIGPSEPCDRQPYFERALVRAVAKGADCMPEKPKEESISFALEVNHKLKTTRLFAGRSGTVKGAQAKPVVACVQKFLTEPAWDSIPHDHPRYVIGVLALYRAEKRQ